jgi:dipeptidase E
MVGKLFLAGGGDEKQSFDIDKVFLQGVSKILYIPYAWNRKGDFESCKDWFTNCMKQHKKITFTMLTDLSNSPDLNTFDAIYIGGGNTFRLLKHIKETGFDSKLLSFFKNGGTVYGGSAGALIWGNDIGLALICADKDKNLVKLKDTSGLNVINNCDIQCHYKDDQIEEHLEYLSKTNRNIIAIPEESALLVTNKGAQTIGNYPISLFKGGGVKKINPGEFLK